MSILESGAWRALPPAEKEHLRNRLAEKHARNGNPIGGPATPGALAVRHEPNIQVQRPHLELIDQALTWVKDTPNAKLMIWTPPQIGKSVRVSRWLPFWWLTHRPQDRILMASYAASLAETHGAACRDLISAYGARYGLQLKSDENTRSDWSLTAGGGLRSRGTKGGITGQSMNCMSGETSILTREGPQRIQDIVAARTFPEVLSYNHTTHTPEWRPVIATRSVPRRPIVEVRTTAGRIIRCTKDHRIYTQRGYVNAGSLRAGDRLTVASAPDLLTLWGQVRTQEIRCAEGHIEGQHDENILQSQLLPGNQTGYPDRNHLPLVPGNIHDPEIRVGQEGPSRDEACVLLEEVLPPGLSDPLRAPMQAVWGQDGRRSGSPILLEHMPHRRTPTKQDWHETANGKHLPPVRSDVPSEVVPDDILRSGLRERGTLESDDRERELPLSRRDQLCDLVSEDASTDPRTRRTPVRGMSPDTTPNRVHPEGETLLSFVVGDPSHQRETAGQSIAEPDYPLRGLPHAAPSQARDTVSVVREVCGEPVTVYDLQVEGNSNFFADEVLVHNCGIIDDPYADRAAADSSTIRKAVWEWYSSAFISRRSPGARQIVVHTRWHQQDLSGMLLEREGRVEDGGEWKVVHLPAIATAPDPERGFREDSLGRAPGEPLTHPLIDSDDTAALNDHWVRQKASVTTRDWAAMFMGSPVTAEGALLSAENLKNATTKDVPAPRRTVVGVDPSGGGRDTAGIIGGHLGTDGRMYWTHDRTAQMSSDQWSRAACQLAHDIDADCVVFEANYGGDMAGTLIRQAWDAMQNEGAIDRRALCPRIKKVTARKSKFLRAEPIAQAVLTQRAWFSADHSLAGLKSEWELWEPDSTWSPGALDAAVYCAYELLPAINSGSSVSSAAKRSRSSITGASSLAARRTR